jgi:hypothetical protein
MKAPLHIRVLIQRLGIDDAALTPLAEIVHDSDLKDSKFGREETVGIERLIAAVDLAHRDDETRLRRSAVVFDDLYEYFKRKGA